MGAAREFVDGNGFYQAWQLTGSYTMDSLPVLYPPYSLLLFVPFTVLPAVLWWAVPLTVLVVVVRGHKPRPWTWPVLIAGFGWANTVWLVLAGNPGMWAAAAFALGTRLGWPSAFVLVKPSLAPFAFVGVRGKRWWALVAILGAASVLLAPMWSDYVQALSNFRNDRGLAYSVGDLPLFIAIAAAWLGGEYSPLRSRVALRLSRSHPG
jgi:hypothetical protein